jgi:CPA2 family monovalent cation:H+ antiporter-2
MLFDPSILVREPWAVLAVLFLILIAKSVAAFAIVLLLRYPFATALTVSASLAQIGEFSFILAGLGMSLGVLPVEGRDLIIAGALLSITLNPLAFMLVDAVIGSPERERALPHWLKGFGGARFASLREELLKTQERMAARQAKRGLQAQALVSSFPIFSELDQEQLQELLLLFHPRSASPGERLIRKGDRADSMFFISSGAVEVLAAGQKIRLGPGDFFGEMALLSRSRRTADVTAIAYCQFFTLDQVEFRNFIARNPQVRAHIDRLAAERSEMNKRQEAQLLQNQPAMAETKQP